MSFSSPRSEPEPSAISNTPHPLDEGAASPEAASLAIIEAIEEENVPPETAAPLAAPSIPARSLPIPTIHRRPMLGISFKILAALSFSLMGAFVKAIGTKAPSGIAFPLGQITFFRSACALIPILIWIIVEKQTHVAFRTKNPMGHVIRSILGCCGMFFGFAGLARIPLVDATAISFAAPLFSIVLAALVLKENVRMYRWSAVIIGFLGVMIMLSPYFDFSTPRPESQMIGVFFCLCGALTTAFAMMQVSSLSKTEHTSTIVMSFVTLGTLLTASTYIWGLVFPSSAWQMPSTNQLAMLILMGMCGGFGQIFMTSSYRYADASTIAPFDYTAMIWALLIGWLVFGDWPEKLVLAGASIVVASGLFVIFRERALGIERKKEREAGSTRAH